MKVGEMKVAEQSFGERMIYARDYTKEILNKVWLYVVVAIALGGFIHGYAPEDFLVQYAGKDNIWAVPMAVLIVCRCTLMLLALFLLLPRLSIKE